MGIWIVIYYLLNHPINLKLYLRKWNLAIVKNEQHKIPREGPMIKTKRGSKDILAYYIVWSLKRWEGTSKGERAGEASELRRKRTRCPGSKESVARRREWWVMADRRTSMMKTSPGHLAKWRSFTLSSEVWGNVRGPSPNPMILREMEKRELDTLTGDIAF